MRPTTWFACVLLLFSLIATQAVLATESTKECILPTGLHEEIAKRYSHAKLVVLNDLDEHDRNLFQKDHAGQCPGLVRAMLSGDERIVPPAIELGDEVRVLGEGPRHGGSAAEVEGHRGTAAYRAPRASRNVPPRLEADGRMCCEWRPMPCAHRGCAAPATHGPFCAAHAPAPAVAARMDFDPTFAFNASALFIPFEAAGRFYKMNAERGVRGAAGGDGGTLGAQGRRRLRDDPRRARGPPEVALRRGHRGPPPHHRPAGVRADPDPLQPGQAPRREVRGADAERRSGQERGDHPGSLAEGRSATRSRDY